MRAVLDVNVLISALLSSSGAPAQAVRAWQAGRYELVVSPLLLDELERALAYPKLRRRITASDAMAFIDWLQRSATLVEDPSSLPPARTADPGDDYLLALAASQQAVLVSGDGHLLALSERFPIETAAAFLGRLDT